MLSKSDESIEKIFPLKAIFWDMDGTLVDTEPSWQSAEFELMETFGYHWLDEDSAHCIGGPMERVAQYLCDKSGSHYPPSWFSEQLISRMKEKLIQPAHLLDGVSQLLEEARAADITQAIVSASDREIVDLIHRSIPDFFSFSISANDVVESKPKPDCYLLAANKLGLQIEECLIIEDSFVGISAAIASGALVLAVTNNFQPQPNVVLLSSLKGLELKDLQRYHHQWQLDRSGLPNG